MNEFYKFTDFAKLLFFNVAKPKSPILTHPVVPFIKILSHFKSLCMIGGARECKNAKPFRICLHHDFNTLGLIFLNLRKYLKGKNGIAKILRKEVYFLNTKIICF